MNLIQIRAGVASILATSCRVSLRPALFSTAASGEVKFPSEEYEKNGFFVVRKLVSDENLDKYARRFKKICEEKIRVPVMTVMKDVAIAKSEFLEGEKAITKVQDFCFDEELFDFCRLDEIVGYVKHVTGPNIMAMHTMLINKPPGRITIPTKFEMFF